MSELYDIVVNEGVNISVEDDVMIYMPTASLVGWFPDAVDQTQAFSAMNGEEMYALIPLEGYQLIPQWDEDAYEGSILNAMVIGGFLDKNGKPLQATEQPCGIQYNNWYEGVFRVLSPYQDLGITGGSMEVVMSDPDCVLVGLQSTGIRTGDGIVYIISRALYYESKEDFFASEDAPYAITYDAETNRVNFLTDALLFYFPPTTEGGSPSVYLSGAPAGWIQLPDNVGVKDIENDVIDTNAPKVYYNLQGVQVANPTAGQIYIVKQGSKVTKQVIR